MRGGSDPRKPWPAAKAKSLASGDELSDLSDMGRIFSAVFEHRQVDGREREMQTEHGLASNQVSLAMLRGEEHRAITPAPGDVGQTQAEIIPYVFPQSVAAFLGVDMPTVGVGEAVFPVLTKKLDVRTPARVGRRKRNHGELLGGGSEPRQTPGGFLLLPRGSGAVCRHGCILAAKPERGPVRRLGRGGRGG